MTDYDRAKNIRSVTVRAPCSTANLGPGFDMFGMALDAFYDEVTLTKKPESFGMKIVSSDNIPLDPSKNTAGLVAKKMTDGFGLGGLEIKIKKNIPPGYGMGSSAASAAACAVGLNRLYGMQYGVGALTWFAGIGEKASAGVMHFDNVAASLCGGFVLVGSEEETNPNGHDIPLYPLEVSKDLRCCIAVPKIKVPKQKTKISRAAVPKNVKFSDALTNQRNAIRFTIGLGGGLKVTKIPGFYDEVFEISWYKAFEDYMDDVIVVPARKKMIPGYDSVEENARVAGALGVTISGAGPSVIAFANKDGLDGHGRRRSMIKEIGEAMRKGFKSAKVDCEIVICKPSKGARVTKIVK